MADQALLDRARSGGPTAFAELGAPGRTGRAWAGRNAPVVGPLRGRRRRPGAGGTGARRRSARVRAVCHGTGCAAADEPAPARTGSQATGQTPRRSPSAAYG